MTGITDKELDQLLRDAQERADSYPFDDYILEVAIPALVAEVRHLRAAIENVLKEHEEIWSCGNPRHTNPEVGCPDCSVECDACGCTYPCETVMAIRDAIGGAEDSMSDPWDTPAEAGPDLWDDTQSPHEYWYGEVRGKYRDQARAALAAMPQPIGYGIRVESAGEQWLDECVFTTEQAASHEAAQEPR